MKLNTYKNYKDKWLPIVVWMIIAYVMMLLPLCWGSNMKAASETETAWTSEIEFPFAITSNSKFCVSEIAQELRNIKDWIQSIEWAEWLFLNADCDYKYEWLERAEQSRNAERYPWKLTEDWSQQEMPIIQTTTNEHERFKELATAYGIDASKIWTVENHYWIREWVILCITIAETSGGWRWYWQTNPWNVGNNDRWDRVQYAFYETWLEKIGQTLTNKYLWKKLTLWCLSNAWSCSESSDNGSRYATSDGSWQRNMIACLSTIYWKIDPSTFSIRR